MHKLGEKNQNKQSVNVRKRFVFEDQHWPKAFVDIQFLNRCDLALDSQHSRDGGYIRGNVDLWICFIISGMPSGASSI